jgi:hypothetical protein
VSENKPKRWQAGQRAVIDRRTVVQIVRVTPSGRAIVGPPGGERTFEPSGFERVASGYRRARLEPWSEEIEAEIAHAIRTQKAFRALGEAVSELEKWMRDARPRWQRDFSELADVEAAERITKAIETARSVAP